MEKKFTVSLLFICTLFCSLVGCSGRDYGGIVTDFYLTDTDIVIETSDDLDDIEYYCYQTIIIYNIDFEYYGCNDLAELLHNQKFVSSHKKYNARIQSFGSFIISDKTHQERESVSYMLFYGGMELPEDYNLPDFFFEVEDLTNYRGYIKF